MPVIYRVTDRVLGSGLLCPGDVYLLEEYGVTHVVILVEEFELECWPSIEDYMEELYERGIGHTWFPVRDGEAPDPDEALRLYKTLARLEKVGRILFHCYGGTGRTPMMIMGYLITVHGLSLEEAYETVRAAAPHVDLTTEQLIFLEMLDKFYRGAVHA
ncbi:MAG: protein phosphatase [Crenarchaeota archaeon]|nr:protein phosphatase [Thermoproteota archaeon]